MATEINIKIGGKAGEGIKTTGLILSKIFSRLGFSVFGYDEYPSLVKGGHNTYQAFISPHQATAQKKQVDLLIALDKDTPSWHESDLSDTSFILTDFEAREIALSTNAQILTVPTKELALKSGGSAIMANMVSLGAVCSLYDLKLAVLHTIIDEIFSSKGEAIIKGNREAATAGFEYVKTTFQDKIQHLETPEPKDQLIAMGNEAIVAGAISAGVKYFAAYPMTPISSLLNFMAEHGHTYNVVVNHTESEIAAINTCLGASAAGIRVMTATSGGGFCLMAEGLGMAGGAEIPLVIVWGMRPGPATGMPTWTGQGDLEFALHASQDEFPRVVFTPGNVKEAFSMTRQAFELAEKYQLPVIILTDKLLNESYQTCDRFETSFTNERFGFVDNPHAISYNRYALTEANISPRPRLGQKQTAAMLANSYEHNEEGFGTESLEIRNMMMAKRHQKLVSLQAQLPELPLFGNPKAPYTLIGFGSTLGVALEALKVLPNVKYLHFNYVWPFPTDQVTKLLKASFNTFCLEGNFSGQLEAIIRQQTGLTINHHLRKFDGQPFFPDEVVKWLQDTIAVGNDLQSHQLTSDEKLLLTI